MKRKKTDCIRLDPESRICSEYDSCSLRKMPSAASEEMGFRVEDDFHQEHIQ